MRQLSSADWTMVSLDTATAHNTIGMVGIYDPSTRPGRSADLRRGARVHRGPPPRRRELPRADGRRAVRASTGRGGSATAGSTSSTTCARSRCPGPGSWRQFCTQIARIHARPLDLDSAAVGAVPHRRPRRRRARARGRVRDVPARAPRRDRRRRRRRDPHRDPHPRARRRAAASGAEGYTWEPDPVPSDVDLLRRAVVNGVTRPVGRPAASPAGWSARSRSCAADSKNPDVTSPASLPKATRFNHAGRPAPGVRHVVHDARRAEGDPHRRCPEAKINDIGLAVVGGAIRAYLLEQGRAARRVADRHDADLDPARR